MTDETVKKIRAMFPNVKKRAYFMHGFMATLPDQVDRTAQNMLDLSPNNHVSEKFLQGLMNLDASRRLFAELIGATADEIAITHNTTEAVNLAAELIDLPAGANVIVSDLEHPCTTYPWILRQAKGVEVRHAPAYNNWVSLEGIKGLLDKNTRAIHVSHVSHITGQRYDLNALSAIAQENRASLIIDASQSAGVTELSLNQIQVDFLATCGYKWLLGPVGTGFLYIRKELCEKYMPVHAGWRTAVNPLNLDPSRVTPPLNASKFEIGGMPNICGLAALNEGMKIISEYGIGRVEKRIEELSGYCMGELKKLGLKLITPSDPSERGPLVAMEVEDANSVREYLAQKNILVSGTSSANMLRVDIHFFNTVEEIDRLIEALADALSIPIRRGRKWFGFLRR